MSKERFASGPRSNLAGAKDALLAEGPPLILERQMQFGPLIDQDELLELMRISKGGLEVMLRNRDLIRISTGDQLYFPRNYFVEDDSGRWSVLPGLSDQIRIISKKTKSALETALELAKPFRKNGKSKIDLLREKNGMQRAKKG